ncbi:hypothetical protein [Actinacidiphila oryziradicis]|uniref:hypothetical protein n=1 Tax=Actinacidiphila oryziradicis TaxID=2571141 RepID=UPI00145C7EB3|nr:hypothetical protein [Actinacidiphila oryziradicis]
MERPASWASRGIDLPVPNTSRIHDHCPDGPGGNAGNRSGPAVLGGFAAVGREA